MIYRGARFVVTAVVFGPLISGLLVSAVMGSLLPRPIGPLELLVTEIGFAIGGYYFGTVPAAIASILIVVRRRVSFVEALAIASVTTFLVYFVFISASSWLSEVSNAAGLGFSMALVSIPAAICSGLLAAWWGAFSPPRLPEHRASGHGAD